MQTILVVFHLFLAIGLIGLVLMQHGKGADAGAAFGSGASATVFGAQGSASFLSRATALLAALFFITSIALAVFASQKREPEGLMDAVGDAPAAVIEQQESASDLPVVATPAAPAAPEADVPVSAALEADVPAPAGAE